MRVLRITYGPGEKSVMHEHPDALAAFLTDGQSQFHLADGSRRTPRRRRGPTLWTPAGKHLPENTGDQALRADPGRDQAQAAGEVVARDAIGSSASLSAGASRPLPEYGAATASGRIKCHTSMSAHPRSPSLSTTSWWRSSIGWSPRGRFPNRSRAIEEAVAEKLAQDGADPTGAREREARPFLRASARRRRAQRARRSRNGRQY